MCQVINHPQELCQQETGKVTEKWSESQRKRGWVGGREKWFFILAAPTHKLLGNNPIQSNTDCRDTKAWGAGFANTNDKGK